MRRLITYFLPILLVLGLAASCYYTPQKRRSKADPSYLSEADAEKLIQKKLAPYGIKFISNMKLKRGDAVFVADGYDRDLRIGYEYRSYEGRDFERDGDDNPDGLSDSEIEILEKRQAPFREYFLIVPEGPSDEVSQAVDMFVKDLYTWEVLKKAKPKSSKDSLFPEKKKGDKDLLPWESTKDLRKKRKEMEAREELEEKPGEEEDLGGEWGSDDEWGSEEEEEEEEEGGETGTGDDEDDWGFGESDEEEDF